MKILIAMILAGAASGIFAAGVYDYSVTTVEGATFSLDNCQGKKILIAVLPVTQTADDSAFLQRLDSLALADAGTLKIVGVPSYEDGYSDSALSSLQTYYRYLLDTSVVISQGIYTRQSSGSLQNPLFNWLTHASGNTHFEQEVGGPGEMYFINEQGDLYGVFAPEVRMSNKILHKMLD